MKAEIYKHSQWIPETDPEILMFYFCKALERAEFNVLDFMQHRFEPEGYTAIWLLAESHFAIHTFPEHRKSYIELSSCNIDKHNKFLDLIKHEYEQNRTQ